MHSQESQPQENHPVAPTQWHAHSTGRVRRQAPLNSHRSLHKHVAFYIAYSHLSDVRPCSVAAQARPPIGTWVPNGPTIVHNPRRPIQALVHVHQCPHLWRRHGGWHATHQHMKHQQSPSSGLGQGRDTGAPGCRVLDRHHFSGCKAVRALPFLLDSPAFVGACHYHQVSLDKQAPQRPSSLRVFTAPNSCRRQGRHPWGLHSGSRPFSGMDGLQRVQEAPAIEALPQLPSPTTQTSLGSL